jgi:hypothetical protein
MAIGTDAAVEFYGTQDDLDSTSAAVADDAFSVVGDLVQWTNDDDAPYARVILESTFSTTPGVGSTVELFAQLIDIEGTNDTEIPTANHPHIPVAIFAIKDQTAIQRDVKTIKLPNVETSQVYQFWIRVNTGSPSASAGWTVFITPITEGPHA